jgi:hypothetical protein
MYIIPLIHNTSPGQCAYSKQTMHILDITNAPQVVVCAYWSENYPHTQLTPIELCAYSEVAVKTQVRVCAYCSENYPHTQPTPIELSAYSADTDQTMCILGGGGEGTGESMRIL